MIFIISKFLVIGGKFLNIVEWITLFSAKVLKKHKLSNKNHATYHKNKKNGRKMSFFQTKYLWN